MGKSDESKSEESDAADQGIKLFSQSKKRLKSNAAVDEASRQATTKPNQKNSIKKKRKKLKEGSGNGSDGDSSSSSELDQDLIKESAVDCDWILQKKGAYP